MQTRSASLLESVASNLAGLVLIWVIQCAVFPAFGIHVTAQTNITIATILACALIAKSYAVRRWFNGRG